MVKHLVCPICQTVNDVDASAVGCYVLCRNCPHRFYVPVPPLGEDLRDEPQAPPSVVPDYKAWEQRLLSRAKGIEDVAFELSRQRVLVFVLLAMQVATGLMVLWLLFSRR